jgi:hypothetical protein
MIEHRYRQTKSQAPKELTMAIGYDKLQYVSPFDPVAAVLKDPSTLSALQCTMKAEP